MATKESVVQYLRAEDLLPSGVAEAEVSWFFTSLGMAPGYFESVPTATVAGHVAQLYAAKIVCKATKRPLKFEAADETSDQATFIVESDPDATMSPSRQVEQQIHERYLDATKEVGRFDVMAFRTEGKAAERPLRLYLLSRSTVERHADNRCTDLKQIASPGLMLRLEADGLVSTYQSLVQRAVTAVGCVVEYAVNTDEQGQAKGGVNDWYHLRVAVAYREGRARDFFSAVSSLYRRRGMYARLKTLDYLGNGLVVQRLNLSLQKNVKPDQLDAWGREMAADLAHLYVLPHTPLHTMYRSHTMTVDEVSYCFCALRFAENIWTGESDQTAYFGVSKFTADASTEKLIKRRMRRDTFTMGRIAETISAYVPIMKLLFAQFVARLSPKEGEDKDKFERLANEIKAAILRVPDEVHQLLLNTLASFNQFVLKTNFFKQEKNVLAFRLSPECLHEADYPDQPFGIFMLVGTEFLGFHLRFVDVARGGIRIIKSHSPQAHAHNQSMLFEEAYGLAHTQQRKNKDIPEGGAKGVLLLGLEHQDKEHVAWEKFVDGLLDLLLPSSEVKDLHGQREVLFLGPDENSADKMEWAALHAKERGAPFWKAFTTGKPQSMGGIPHDTFGMTTGGVHQNVLCLLEKVGIEEETITKLQTGGPDGDLGSNEILVSKDKTTSVVDGSGVLHDPNGINRAELTRLAELRSAVAGFDRTKLGEGGFLVLVGDQDVTLPDGTVVENGFSFRNGFHLSRWAAAQMFVPCGGRPESINAGNVSQLFDPSTGRPNFSLIVEGANLFLTQDARVRLVNAGVKLVKDASSNKGGVCSSSLEVFACLVLDDETFSQHMAVQDPKNPPAFYMEYVQECKQRIAENARLEFGTLWAEQERTGVAMCVLTDTLSNKINELNTKLRTSQLWENQALRREVIGRYTPMSLQNLIGLDTIMANCPVAYLQAIFGSYVASRYVYRYGLEASEFCFFEFIQGFLQK